MEIYDSFRAAIRPDFEEIFKDRESHLKEIHSVTVPLIESDPELLDEFRSLYPLKPKEEVSVGNNATKA